MLPRCAIATLTTVGYGDIYPVTIMGKVIATSLAFIGVGLIAIPAGLISAAYVEEVNSFKEKNYFIVTVQSPRPICVETNKLRNSKYIDGSIE